jgi:hypothetical protein
VPLLAGACGDLPGTMAGLPEFTLFTLLPHSPSHDYFSFPFTSKREEVIAAFLAISISEQILLSLSYNLLSKEYILMITAKFISV